MSLSFVCVIAERDIDFDFGETRLVELSEQTNFPWVLSNAVQSSPSGPTDFLLASAHEYIIKSMGGYKIGFFGLAGTYVQSPSDFLRVAEIRPETGHPTVSACPHRTSSPPPPSRAGFPST